MSVVVGQNWIQTIGKIFLSFLYRFSLSALLRFSAVVCGRSLPCNDIYFDIRLLRLVEIEEFTFLTNISL